MSVRWLDALLVPVVVSPHRNFWPREDSSVTPQAAAALLIQMRTSEYARLVRSGSPLPSDVPDLGDGTIDENARMLGSIIAVLNDDSRALDLIKPLLRSSDSDVAAASAIVASVAAAHLDRTDESVAILRDARRQLRESATAVDAVAIYAVDIHLAGRLHQQDASIEAAEIARGAFDALKGLIEAGSQVGDVPYSWSSSGETVNTLLVLRASCANTLLNANDSQDFVFLAEASTWFPGVSSIYRTRSLARAFEADLRERFNVEYRGALTRVVQFGLGTELESELISASLTTELAGDITQIHNRDRARAHYSLIKDLDLYAEEAVKLLIRSRDYKSLRLVLNRIKRRGPLKVLRDLTIEYSTYVDPRITATVLRFGADVAPDSLVDDALTWAITQSRVAARLGRRGVANFEDIWHVVDALVPRLPGPEIDKLARDILERATESDDVLVLRSLTSTANIVDWSKISEQVVEAWTTSAIAWLDEGDRASLASTVAIALGRLGNPTVLNALTHRLRLHPSISSVATAIDAGAEIPQEGLDAIVDQLKLTMLRTREDAANGSHSFGGVDVAHVAGVIAMDYRPSIWADLIVFLLDQNVSGDDKAGLQSYLSYRSADLPPDVAHELRQNLESLMRNAPDFWGNENELQFDPSGFRLAISLGALDGSEVLIKVAEMSNADNPRLRLESARLLVVAQDFVDGSAYLSSLLQLNRDEDIDVSAMSASITATGLGRHENSIRRVLRHESVSILESGGTSRSLAWLRAATSSPGATDPELEAVVRRVADEHDSYLVRDFARRWIDELPFRSGKD